MRIVNVMQGSEEWKRERAGRITGSRMIDVLALTQGKTQHCVVNPGLSPDDPHYIVKPMRKGKGYEKRVAEAEAAGFKVTDVMIEPPRPQQARLDYGYELAFERIAGTPQLTRDTIEMRWGRNCEPYARFEYEARTGITVKQVGFCILESDYIGMSPDGLVRDDGGIEIKSPYNGRIHMETWDHGMPEDHMPQVQAEMWISGRQWWDFVSFDPRVDKHLQLYIQTIPRDDDFIARLAIECDALNTHVETLVRRIRAKNKTMSQKANNYEAIPTETRQAPILTVKELMNPIL